MSTIAATAGTSPTGTSIDQISQSMKTGRNVTIEITNHSQKYILANPKAHTTSGYCFHPPQPTIAKNTTAVCAFSKTARVARGAVGVLTYQMLRDEKCFVAELAIMFSVPFDYNWYENWFALGIYKQEIPCDEALFSKMYYDTGPFTRCKSTGSTLTYSGRGVLVKATMSAGGRSVMKIEFWDE
ncbi:DELTA-actitoxin-Ate1a-like [Colossoma macropomum]|uniref:DELTA-actitoxin-Ate1a-like n=1 Tax=Colossoma macropomum TaxID=42526 RepID=UPI0018640A05|nr:DELTA-actitoxin-Ate1a-like [Colossoma macropomum]